MCLNHLLCSSFYRPRRIELKQAAEKTGSCTRPKSEVGSMFSNMLQKVWEK
jgi:hypothetical protein